MTQDERHYTKAPITEAILDLKVALPEDTPPTALQDIQALVRDQYPNMQPLVTGSMAFQVGPSVRVDATQQHTGYIFRSQDGRWVCQVALNGFTFNHLRPYDSWEVLRDEAKRLWEIYKEVCKPVTVRRISLRYINQLELPNSLTDLEEYLRTRVEIPREIPHGISAFFMQLQVPQPDLGCTLILNEALSPQTDPTVWPIILDFDLFREDVWQSDDPGVWQLLEDMRVRKNALFEASITDATRKLFD